jgi:tetratricopeptide (TPR) repeat protein
VSYKQKRKEIREPDQFMKASAEYWALASANKKLIVSVAAGLLALALVIIVFSNVSKAKTQASGEALLDALTLAERPIQGTPQALLSGADLPAFATAQDKYTALADGLTKLRVEHEGTRAASVAAYYLADAQMKLGKHDEADALYEEFLRGARADSPLRLMAIEGRGYVAEKRGNTDGALAFFEQLGRDSQDDTWKAKAAYHRGRMLVLKGQKAEAAEAFDRVAKDFTKATAIVLLAQDRLALLAAEGVRPPAAAAAQAAL